MKDQPLHIFVFSSWYPTDEKPFLGNFAVQQARTLAKKYRVTFFRLVEMGKPDTVFKEEEEFTCCTAYYKPAKNPFRSYLNKKKAMKEALKTVESVDLIHAHVSYPMGWVIAYLKRTLKKPLLLTEHGSYFRDGFKWDVKFTLSIYLAHKAADQIVAVSPFLRKDILKRVYGKQVDVVFNPVAMDASIVEKSNNVFELLHVSTLDEVKHVEPLIEAIAALIQEGRSLHLTIVSDENPSKVKLEVNRFGINDSVTFEGPISHSEMSKFYKKAAVFVLNSHYESFSIVIAEAWSNGIPVVSTSVGIADQMPEFLGELTDGTVPSIKAALVKLMENRDKIDPQLIVEHAKQFSEEAFLSRIDGIYRSLLK